MKIQDNETNEEYLKGIDDAQLQFNFEEAESKGDDVTCCAILVEKSRRLLEAIDKANASLLEKGPEKLNLIKLNLPFLKEKNITINLDAIGTNACKIGLETKH